MATRSRVSQFDEDNKTLETLEQMPAFHASWKWQLLEHAATMKTLGDVSVTGLWYCVTVETGKV